MVIIQGLKRHHALVQVVTIIISKPHQLSVVDSVTTQNQWKQSTKHAHQDLNGLSPMKYPFENNVKNSTLISMVLYT